MCDGCQVFFVLLSWSVVSTYFVWGSRSSLRSHSIDSQNAFSFIERSRMGEGRGEVHFRFKR